MKKRVVRSPGDRNPMPLNIADAVYWNLVAGADSGGVIERAADKADSAVRVIGQLIELLCEKGVISNEEAAEFCRYGEEVVDDTTT